jgi:glyoxylase-like metal-dependent hydrolase (beta-lactamase superfamily II)
MTTFARRRMLTMMAGIGAGWTAGPLIIQAGIANAAEPVFSTQTLENGAFLISTDYANVLGLQTPEGVVLVGGVRQEHAAAFLEVLDAHTSRAPVVLAYNTHWHWDHTGSNEVLRQRGARLIAHENTRLWLTNEFYVDWEDREYGPRPAEALPTETFYTNHAVSLGGEDIHSGLLFQAHTDGDIYVHLRGRNILVVGDVVADGTYPVMDPVTGGWIGGLTKAQERLLAIADDNTLIIPGSGGIMDKAALRRQYDMLVEIRERIYEFARQGKGPREMLSEGVASGLEAWGDPTRFVLNAYPGLGRHYREVDGVV